MRILSALSRLIHFVLDAYERWKLEKIKAKTQDEFDAIERDPVPEFKRMFDRNESAKRK